MVQMSERPLKEKKNILYQKTVRDAIIQQKVETIEELIEAATLVKSSTGQTQDEARLL